MNQELDVFRSDQEKSFDSFCRDNGFRSWSARWLMERLGYADFSAFQKAINKAMQVCLTLNVGLDENFKKEDSDRQLDFRLSRFACYLTVMHADPRKPEVARAQAFFAESVEQFRQAVKEAEEVERVTIREEISDHEKSLNSAAKAAGVEKYAFFQNKGYLGLYNMSLQRLKDIRQIPSNRTPLDFMGKEELAANLFRVTQTEAKIRNENIRGQRQLESTAYNVGKKVRDTMIELGGNKPEELPVAEDIRKVHSALRGTHRGFKKLDSRSGK